MVISTPMPHAESVETRPKSTGSMDTTDTPSPEGKRLPSSLKSLSSL
jgi:hypothetical protein